jgi:hypothetical protein
MHILRSLSKLTPDMDKVNVSEYQKGDYKWGGSFGLENI